MLAGFDDEAKAWRDWLLRAVAGDPAQLQIMYGLGRRAPAARVRAPLAPRLRGLEPGPDRQRRREPVPARRVRRGDGRAAPVLAGVGLEPTDPAWAVQQALLGFLTTGQQPDEGIWEVRGATPALRPLEGDGLGRLRPRREGGRAVRPRRARSTAGGSCATRSTTRSARRASTPRSTAFVQSYGGEARSTPAC